MDFKEYVTQREIIKENPKELARLNELVEGESLSFEEAYDVFDTVSLALEESLGLPIEVVNVKVDALAELLSNQGVINLQELTDNVSKRLLEQN